MTELDREIDRLGHCYELTGRKIVTMPDGYLLVHGTIQAPLSEGPEAQLGPISHAWIVDEHGTSVWEPVTDRWYPAELFESGFRAVTQVVYTWASALDYQLTSGHFGLWHEEAS